MSDILLESFNIWRGLLRKVDPSRLIPESLSADEEDKLRIGSEAIPFSLQKGAYITGTGKASAGMALGMEKIPGLKIHEGMVISTPGQLHKPGITKVLTGSHPYPDHDSFGATDTLIRYIRQLPDDSQVINLISGGTSALLCRPAKGIPEKDITTLYKKLVTSGADIGQINTVRKAVSAVKGGRLLSEMKNHHLIDLIISDVPDDNPEDIGSGPTTPQSVSAIKARSILEQAGLWKNLPGSIRKHINQEADRESETGEFVSKDINRHQQFILSSARMVASEAATLLESRNYNVNLESRPWSGNIGDFEKYILRTLDSMLESGSFPAAHVFFGECTVQVTGSGKGGRNQELALRMAKNLDSAGRKILFLSAGTDGIDGPTDAAGAVVDETTWQEGVNRGADPEKALAENDSYTFFKDTRWHIKTGPTGNNVMDIQILMIPG